MSMIKVAISEQVEYITKILTKKTALPIGLYMSALFLVWSIPGFISPGLFSGAEPSLSIIINYGGIYLLAAALFGLSTAILFILTLNRDRKIIGAFTAALSLIFLLSAGFMGLDKMQPAFYIQGLQHFGIPPVIDTLISAIISLPALSLLTMAVIIPFILFNHFLAMDKSCISAFLLGTILFPFMMAAAFGHNYINTGSQCSDLIISTLCVLFQGFALSAVICIPMFVPGLLKEPHKELKNRNILVFGFYITCIILIWFIPGFFEQGFFILGGQSPLMADSGTFSHISEEVRYFGILILLPVLFGCSAALLNKGVDIGKELLNRNTGFVITTTTGILILLSLIPDLLADRNNLSPPFYIPEISNFGLQPLADAILSLMVFIPQLAIATLGIVTSFLILRNYLPLKQAVSAIIITGLFVFPIMMILTFGTGIQPGVIPLIGMELQGFVLGAVGALVIYILGVIDERVAEACE